MEINQNIIQRECLQITNDGRNIFDLRTGEKIEYNGNQKIAGVLPINFSGPIYPGDLSETSSAWAIDSAIALNKIYPSQFFFFIFADPMLKANYQEDPTDKIRKKAIENAYNQIKRFTDYWKESFKEEMRVLVIGTGQVVEFEGFIDLIELTEKYSKYTFMPFEGYTGIFLQDLHGYDYVAGKEPIIKLGSRTPKLRSNFTREEVQFLEELKKKEYFNQVIITSDLIERNETFSTEFLSYAPDILCTAKPGKYFMFPTATSRKLYKIQSYTRQIGYTTLNDWDLSIPLEKITDIFSSTQKNVRKGPSALAIIEAAGPQELPNYEGQIDTTWKNLPYGADHNFLFSINTGKSLFHTPFPYGSDPQAIRTNYYPYSWGKEPLSNAIGTFLSLKDVKARSIAAGSRSMFLHMFSSADIVVEPWVRNRTENGVLYVLNKNQIFQKL